MADVITEVSETGETKVVDTGNRESNYDMSLNRLSGELPQVPSMNAISKLFKPRYVLNVTAEDGTVIPFVYKRIDPGTLLLTQGSPLALNPSVKEQALSMRKQFDDIGINLDHLDKKGVVNESNRDQVEKILRGGNSGDVMKAADELRRSVLKAGVISPEITDDLYENLDDEILDALHEAITGGVTSNTELVEKFHGPPEASE